MAKTIVGKILASIFGEFKNNWQSFVAKLFTKIPSDVIEKVTIAIILVEKLKEWLKSNQAENIVNILPGHWDNDIRAWAIDFLGQYDFKGITELLPKDSHNIATTATSELTGFSFGQSALTTEVVYQNIKA